MVCCKMEKFGGWCEPRGTCYVDPIDNKEYCIFHAPKEHKGVSVEKFNEEVHGLIEGAIADKAKCNLSGTVFPGDTSFEQYGKARPLPPINFRQATFSGSAVFSSATFSDKVIFSGVKFNDGAEFNETTFSDEADFKWAKFSGSAVFSSATFRDRAIFSATKISGCADFLEAVFAGEADFSGVKFSGETDFCSAIFSGPAVFTSATFGGEADFSVVTFSGKVAFSSAIFSGDVGFWKATFSGDAVFESSTFIGDVDFPEATFRGAATFSWATFNGETIFEEEKIKTFNGTVLFLKVKTGNSRIFFRGVNFSAIPFSFLETDLSKFRFDRCIWPRKKYSGLFTWLNNKTFGLIASDDTAVFYDEIQADYDWTVKPFWKKFSCTDLLPHFGMVEDLYRQMKVQYKEQHNEPEASKWHYREKEMFRKKKVGRRYFPLSISNLYWVFSGYGERPVRAGVMLVALCALITGAMNWFGLEASSSGEPINGVTSIQGFSFSPDRTKIVLAIQSTIEHVLFVKDPIFKAKAGWGAIILALWTKLLIPIQAALFAFALRNKFRR